MGLGGRVDTGVDQRKVKAQQHADSCCPTSWPPNSTPRMIDAIVRPSIQPLATSCEAGSSSVRMPYLAGE